MLHMVGTSLNHYRILRQIGAGGMGEVYEAQDRKHHRNVAIKVLPATVAADPERRDRFEREARAVSNLNHWGDETELPVVLYSEEEVKVKADIVFQHVFRAYPTVPSPFYEGTAE